MAVNEGRAEASISAQARRAQAEAGRYIDRLTQLRSSSADAEELLALSPEARMLVASGMARTSLITDPVERVKFEVFQLMSEGRATIDELVSDISSMSPEGRRYAFEVLMAHPEYRVKGSRWHSGPLRVDEHASPTNPDGYTSYQVLVDMLREVIASSEEPRPATVDDTPAPVRWALIQDAARRDRNQGARAAVHRAEERFRRGYLGPTAWFFSDGAWNFVALIDGKLVGASRDHVAEFPAEDPITFKTTTSGSVRSVTIGPAMMLDPRPRSEVERLLALAGANSADESRELLPLETAFDSRLGIPPSRGSAEAEVSASAGSVREALVQLEELRSTALITEQEYTAKRTEILGRL